jgi:hypothetical protein
MYNINPITFFGIVFNRVQIVVQEVLLDTSARISATIISEDGGIKIEQTVDLMGEKYNQWSNDDHYVVEAVEKKCGVEVV